MLNTNKASPTGTKIPLGLFTLVLFSIVVLYITHHYDQLWSIWLHENVNRDFGELMRRTLWGGDLPGGSDPATIFLLVCMVLYLKSWSKNASNKLYSWRPFLGFILFSGLTGALGVVQSLKWVIGRARPYEVWNNNWPFTEWYEFGPHYITEGIYSGSFPSGHTSVMLSLLTLSYIWNSLKPQTRMIRFGTTVWTLVVISSAVLMAIGRSVMAHHWISDSLGAILPVWAILHAIYYHLLKIPQQIAYYEKHPVDQTLPRYWELKLAALALPVLIGVMAIFLGFRSLEFQDTPWLLALSFVGVILVSLFWMRCKDFYFMVISEFMDNGD